MSEVKFENRLIVTDAMAKEFASSVLARTTWFKFACALAADILFLVAAFFIWRHFDVNYNLILALFCAGVSVGFTIWFLRLNLRRMRNITHLAGTRQRVEFGDHIKIIQGVLNFKLDYTQITKFSKFKHIWVLEYKGGAVMLDPAGFTAGGDAAKFDLFLHEKLRLKEKR